MLLRSRARRLSEGERMNHAGFLRIALISTLLAAGVALSVTGESPRAIAEPAPNLTVDGGQVFQTIDGFGVNANSAGWSNGNLRGGLDQLIDLQGSNTWRVMVEGVRGWEDTNDNNDPNAFNWTYYNALYETPK